MIRMAPATGLDKPCPGCQVLTLKTLLKCASILGGGKRNDLDGQQPAKVYLEIPPLFLSIQRLKAMVSTCSICRLLYTEIAKVVPANAEFVSLYRYEHPDDELYTLLVYYGERDKLVARIHCYADEGQFLPKRDVNYAFQANNFVASFASEYIMGRSISSAGSPESMAIIKSWLKDCEDHHPQCRSSFSGMPIQSPPILPTRVIDVSRYPRAVHLVVSGGRKAKYVAVSHCWGGQSPVRTTNSTLKGHLKHISLPALSKTIQDAVYVSHSLGIRYLWVDYLCIIQEDDEDFDRESRAMASVYERASCTIAATAARDGTEGCFRRTASQKLVEARCDPDDPTAGVMYFGLKYRSVEENVFGGPLNQRGWVLQEHLFSRRTIHFAGDQMYWECNKVFVGEDHSSVEYAASMQGFPTRARLREMVDGSRGIQARLESRNDGPSKMSAAVHRDWAHLVRYYSRCGLTRSGDKIPAILSLSLALAAILGHSFHEGHYIDNSPSVLSGLLWRAEKDSNLTRPSDNRAPSWSWASLDGAIDFADVDFRSGKLWHQNSTDITVLRVADHRPAGLPPCRALLVSGVVLEYSAHWARPTEAGQDKPTRCKCDENGCLTPRSLGSIHTDDGKTFWGALEYDVAEDRPCRFWLIPIYMCPPVYYVLMVKPAPGHPFEGRVFQRVGMGFILDSDWTLNLDSKFMALI